KEVRDAQAFIRHLKAAELEGSGLSSETLQRMREPRREPTGSVTPHQRVALRMFTARSDASEANYADNRAAFLELHPEDDIPSYEQVKRLVADITGIDAILTDMCINTCLAYVGPFAVYEQCPHCGEPRYDAWTHSQGREVPRRRFQTYPLGPQLQAMWAS
ncbi:hypothetical protein OH77DRAFT_1360845, partial [Trametes cingulata]